MHAVCCMQYKGLVSQPIQSSVQLCERMQMHEFSAEAGHCDKHRHTLCDEPDGNK